MPRKGIPATQAAEVIARNVRMFSREHGLTVDKSLVEERVSELRGMAGDSSPYLQTCAAHANVKTVLRIALREERAQGR